MTREMTARDPKENLMNSHIVKAFDAELGDLQKKIAEMGGIAETMVSDAMDALQKRDIDLAAQVRATDQKLDILQREVEESAILLIAKRQPMAIDLRDVVATIRIASDLERIGDLAKNIAKRSMAIQPATQFPRAVTGLVHLSRLALTQLKVVLDAYTARSVDQALGVWRADGDIDALYTSIFRELLTYMMEDPRNITFCTHLLFCAKNLERIGDHATNIAETIYYLVTGSTLPVDRPKGVKSEDGAADTIEIGT
jgi:phosphate transport system protein